MTGVLHALCNAHHLRELKALVEIEQEDWARRMQRLLRRACHATNLARERGVPLKPGLIAVFERCYDTILADGLAFQDAQPALVRAVGEGKRRGRPPRRVGHNLLLRLSIRKTDVLRFLTDPLVPFSNNLAERDGRMMKLRQKISGGFRSMEGAMNFAVIRSLLSTARKQGWDILQTLNANPDSLIANLRGRDPPATWAVTLVLDQRNEQHEAVQGRTLPHAQIAETIRRGCLYRHGPACPGHQFKHLCRDRWPGQAGP